MSGAFQIYVGAEPAPGYRLRRERGRGAFGEVWEAEGPNGQMLALKFMPSANATSTARELRSLQSLLPLRHTHLLPIYDVWCVPGYIVVVMELADATLLDLMLLYHNELGQRIEISVLCRYLWQVADALDFLNTRQHNRDGRKVGFQHGDVKPNNILLVGETAKLSDYGLATPIHGPITPCPRQGTREYAAPEIFAGYYSERSDQFSLAVTYFVLRTGTFPFPALPSELPRSFSRPAPDLRLVTPEEQAPLQRAMSPIPQDRYPSCREFMADLLRAHRYKVVRDSDDQWLIIRDKKRSSTVTTAALTRRTPQTS
jgi:serine/threonine protein kinase